MNGIRETPSDPLAGLAPTGAPPDLKARILASSRAALLAPPTPPDRWSRLWESRPLRLAWAASVLLLLAAHVLLVRPDPRPAETAALPGRISRGAGDAELAAIGRLPRLDPDAVPLGYRLSETPSAAPSTQAQKENRT